MNYDAPSTGKFVVRVTEVSVVNGDNPATRVKIDSEGGGEFVVVGADTGDPHVGIDPDEWPVLRAVIDAMVASCRDE